MIDYIQTTISFDSEDYIVQNVEFYVDDILIKTKLAEQHFDDLEETFSTLRSYRLKMNPKKVYF